MLSMILNGYMRVLARGIVSRSGAFVRPTGMQKLTSLLVLAALGAFGCASSSGGDAAQPDATADATAAATATSDMPEPPPSAAETSKPVEPPKPPPLPESFTKVQAPFQALITKLSTDIGAANGDCKKISAGLTAFVADKNAAKTIADYKAEEAKLAPEQSKPIIEANNTASSGMMAPVMKCGQEPAHKAAIGAATAKMATMMAGSAAPAAGSATPATSAPPAKTGAPPAKK